MKPKKSSSTGLLRPFSMEEKKVFINRFVGHTEMCELFPDPAQRIQLANEAFSVKWEDALVRVTKLDGTQFFID